MALFGLPSPTLPGTARRALTTAGVGARVVGRLIGDRLRGELDGAAVGRRLREGLEALGATAIKIGQQLSVRADLLPPEVTHELERLTDHVPPLDWEQVPALISAELGRPWTEVFRHIDPRPIGSASLACVYRGALHDGREVAIKVQRPGVARAFSEDLAVMALLTRAFEALTVVRHGFFKNLRFDMRLMFGEELDFRLEARYQRTFRRIVDKAGLSWISAPRVHSSLCTARLLVTEFVQGVSCGAVLAAVERGDKAALEAWGVDPRRLARRLLRFSAWARLQALMLHVDPHPGNIIVLPDDRMVLIDFGACGPASSRSHRNHREVLRLVLHDDHAAVARVMLNDVAPLPYLDRDRLLKEMEASFSRYIRALRTPGAPWSERILAGIWLDMLEVTRRYQIQLNLDTIRAIRAFMLYDTVAYRLDPTMGAAEVRQVLREIGERDARAARGRLGGLLGAKGRDTRRAEATELVERARGVIARVEPTLTTAAAVLRAALKKRDAFLRQIAWGLYASSVGLTLWSIVRALRWLGLDLPSPDAGTLRALSVVATALVLALLARALRRLLFDLDRVEA